MNTFLFWTIAAGTILRLSLALISKGSNDAVYWLRFAEKAANLGFLEAYRTDAMLNHPPIMLAWARVALAVGSERWFPFVLKLPAIAADAVACVLLAKIWLARRDVRGAKLAVIAMAFNPVAILISGFHCNTDNVYAMLSLLTMYLIAERGKFFHAGLALGAAINVKLIPILLIPAAMSLCRSRDDFTKLVKGLAIWIIPFLPLVMVVKAVWHNMIAYVPNPERWGVTMLLHEAWKEPQLTEAIKPWAERYLTVGRGLILVMILWAAAVQWRRRRWNPYELGLLTYAFFLIFAPGFGVQYTVILLPLMIACSIEKSCVYSLLAAIFLVIVYAMALVSHELPLHSMFVTKVYPMPGPLFGLLAWWILIETGATLAIRGWGARPAR